MDVEEVVLSRRTCSVLSCSTPPYTASCSWALPDMSCVTHSRTPAWPFCRLAVMHSRTSASA
eukprot:scaffold11191_cov63-Phaeocystis_antarctica.AAC.3